MLLQGLVEVNFSHKGMFEFVLKGCEDDALPLTNSLASDSTQVVLQVIATIIRLIIFKVKMIAMLFKKLYSCISF